MRCFHVRAFLKPKSSPPTKKKTAQVTLLTILVTCPLVPNYACPFLPPPAFLEAVLEILRMKQSINGGNGPFLFIFPSAVWVSFMEAIVRLFWLEKVRERAGIVGHLEEWLSQIHPFLFIFFLPKLRLLNVKIQYSIFSTNLSSSLS